MRPESTRSTVRGAGHLVRVERRIDADPRRVDDRRVDQDVDGGDDGLAERMPVGSDLRRRRRSDPAATVLQPARPRRSPPRTATPIAIPTIAAATASAAKASEPAHQARLQADCRSVDQAANDSNTSSSSAEETSTGSMPSPSRSDRSLRAPLLVRLGARKPTRPCAAARAACGRRPAPAGRRCRRSGGSSAPTPDPGSRPGRRPSRGRARPPRLRRTAARESRRERRRSWRTARRAGAGRGSRAHRRRRRPAPTSLARGRSCSSSTVAALLDGCAHCTVSRPATNSRKPIRPRAASTLAATISVASRAAAPLSSQGSPPVGSAIPALRSSTAIARGASSAKCSRTMNSSRSSAADSRADEAQSIRSGSSPGTYEREPETSEPVPRRAPCIAPNASPCRRRRETSGKVGAPVITLSPSGGAPPPR